MTARRATASYTADGPPKAGPLVLLRGRSVRRATGFLKGRRITCPEHHVVSEQSRILDDGVVYCDHRTAKEQTPCGALLYLLVFPSRGGRRRLWVADCTRDELATIERLGLDADGVLAYFGAEFTR